MTDIEMREVPFTVDVTVDDPAGIQAAEAVHQLECLEVLRLLPGRRLVARARLNGTSVAAKFFFGKKADRDCRRERAGVSAIANAGVPTPTLVLEGRVSGGYCLAFEWLTGVGRARHGNADAVIALNAKLHEHGVMQTDLHVDNFVLSNERVYTIDGGGIKHRSMRPRASLANLAELLAELDADDAAIDAGYRGYCAARGWVFRRGDLEQLRKTAVRMQRRRVDKFLRKTLRRCSQFEVEQRLGHYVIYERAQMCEELAELLDAPDGFVDSGTLLKSGNTATVARATIKTKRYVIKRYNAKTKRARRSWVNGHRLRFRGIATAKPIALLEPRGDRRAFLILDDLGDLNLARYVEERGVDDMVLDGVERLFSALEADGLTHRDTKATNFIVIDGGVSLVDLDALRPAWSGRDGRSDRRRFLRNFDDRTAARFAARLGVQT